MRPLRQGDVSDSYITGINEPKVQQFLGHDTELSRSDILKFVEFHENSTRDVLLGLFLDEKHCGNIRFHDFDGHSIWLGIALFDRSIWGKGWATRALLAASEEVWKCLICEVIYAGVDNDNLRSFKAFEKAGFVVSEKNPKGFVFQKENPNSNTF